MELKKHVDTMIIMGGILSSFLWMNGKFNAIDACLALIEKDITLIKTVLILKGIMPESFAVPAEK